MWSTDTFSHVTSAADALQSRIEALQAVLRAGPGLASPDLVRELLNGVEDALQVCWAPVVWDASDLEFTP